MAAIHPMRIPGPWREGFALDYQTVDSTFLGHDEFGHPVFDTKRTELGELLYRLKYKRESSAVNNLADTAAGFIRSWISGLQLIVPVPPSKSERTQQPVLILAQAIGERLETPVGLDAVVRVKNLPEAKAKNQKSNILAQEIGLTYVRLSVVEKKLDQQSQADEDMKRGQAELAALGWKNISTTHLTSLVVQLNSEYKRVDRKDKAVAAAAAPQ